MQCKSLWIKASAKCINVNVSGKLSWNHSSITVSNGFFSCYCFVVCHMYSLSISVSSEGFTCDKCREIVRLTVKILDLETRIQTLVEDRKNVRAVDTALDATSSGSPVHCSVLDEPVQQGNWVTMRRHSCGSKHPL